MSLHKTEAATDICVGGGISSYNSLINFSYNMGYHENWNNKNEIMIQMKSIEHFFRMFFFSGVEIPVQKHIYIRSMKMQSVRKKKHQNRQKNLIGFLHFC